MLHEWMLYKSIRHITLNLTLQLQWTIVLCHQIGCQYRFHSHAAVINWNWLHSHGVVKWIAVILGRQLMDL